MNTMTSREFYQHTGKAHKAAQIAPVLITKHGKPDVVVMNYAEYQRLNKAENAQSLYDIFASGDPRTAEIEFELPERTVDITRPDVEF
ncbi:hypothetical protein A4G18_05435 [Pasteurellaceae bacterium Pebbles2]|nr:hypothetical protein [Pasteurellaceae bacterium Pebbles2]